MVNYVNRGSLYSKPRAFILPHEDGFLGFQIIHGSRNFSNSPSPSQVTHNHDDLYHIILFTKEEGKFYYDKTEYDAKKGLLLIISPGEKHNLSSGKRPSCYHEVTFTLYKEGNSLSPPFPGFYQLLNIYAGEILHDHKSLCQLNHHQMSAGDRIFQNMLSGLTREDRKGDLMWQLALNSLFCLIIDIIETPEREPLYGELTLQIERAKKHIDKNYNRVISAHELASLVSCSQGHFFRQFKRTYMMTAVSYQMNLRIGAAKNLIHVGELSLKEIAFQLGFSDVYHFSRIFKRETGLTPGQYRRDLKQKKDLPTAGPLEGGSL